MNKWTLVLLMPVLVACSLSGTVPTLTPSPVVRVAPTASLPVPATKAAEIKRVCVDALNVRFAPVYTASIRGALFRGDVVTIFDRAGGWVRVGVGQWVREAHLC